MPFDFDAVVIGGGVAGSSAAILLAQSGWRVMLAEQHAYPRRKVCGECIAAGNLPLLDRLGVGPRFRETAGPEIHRIGWMDESGTVIAPMPVCRTGPYSYGRALSRDHLDPLLLERAHALGVVIRQPARVLMIAGQAGSFSCTMTAARARAKSGRSGQPVTLTTPVIVDAHGSWERGPWPSVGQQEVRQPRRDSDLFAFKSVFRNTSLAPGFLPVLAFRGGYGGMVVGEDGRTTLACCIRRDALTACRDSSARQSAGGAVEGLLRRSCQGVREALEGADRDGNWMTVGPLNPGIRVGNIPHVFPVGNAAGESHPLIGEGISMALQSSALLAVTLTRRPAALIKDEIAMEMQRAYAAAWRRAFVPRLRLAALYAHVAMRPMLARPARAMLCGWPALLSGGARLAGKAAAAAGPSLVTGEMT